MAKVVYIPMSADLVHPGHLNIIRAGAKLGEVVVGLLTDEAVASRKPLPYLNYTQRYEVISSVKGVSRVIPQTTSDYRPNLRALKPDYVVHGDDWHIGRARRAGRLQVINTLAEWGGKLVELPYTEGISSSKLRAQIRARGVTPAERQCQLRRLLEAKRTIRALEAHDGLSALIVEGTTIEDSQGIAQRFDAIWIGSLTDSIARGKPDNELVDQTSRLATINEVLDVTTMPIIVDADTGGHPEHFRYTVRSLERIGVSAVVVEDKTGFKLNSLHNDASGHVQEDPQAFSAKLQAGLKARVGDDFMIIARIESFILGKGQADALARAKAYIEAGASAIMIHSKDSTGKDIQKFTSAYNKLPERRPLMVVPTSYNQVTVAQLSRWGANIIVYANQLLRAAYPAMEKTASSILKHGRSYEADQWSVSVPDLLELAPEYTRE